MILSNKFTEINSYLYIYVYPFLSTNNTSFGQSDSIAVICPNIINIIVVNNIIIKYVPACRSNDGIFLNSCNRD